MTFPLDYDDPPEAPSEWRPLLSAPSAKLVEFRVHVRDAAGAYKGERYAFVSVVDEDPRYSIEHEGEARLCVVAGRWRAHQSVWAEAHEIRHLTRDQITPAFTVNVDDWPVAPPAN